MNDYRTVSAVTIIKLSLSGKLTEVMLSGYIDMLSVFDWFRFEQIEVIDIFWAERVTIDLETDAVVIFTDPLSRNKTFYFTNKDHAMLFKLTFG